MQLIVQSDIFEEDEGDASAEIIRAHFPDALFLNEIDIHLGQKLPRDYSGAFRGSLSMAARLGRKLEWTNALSWMPALSEWLLRPDDYVFLDMAAITRRSRRMPWPCFIRPATGTKPFSGNVYTESSWANEFRYATTDRNIDASTTCVLAPPVGIAREWRAVFVNGSLASGCRYMVDSEKSVAAGMPSRVRALAEEIGAHHYFDNRFDYVIDIGESEGRLYLIEINAFETSSFYACDLNEIYKKWAASMS